MPISLYAIGFNLERNSAEDDNNLDEMFQYLPNDKPLVRIKDLTYIEGIRDNILMGYGLVVGLDNTGDNIKNSFFTQKELESFLSKIGLNIKGSTIKSKSIAAVMVTGTLKPFARNGNKFDVKVNAMGDAKSLVGGTLLASPLFGADGEVYAVAQGSLVVGGLDIIKNKSTGVVTANKGVRTAAFINDGAIVEKEIDYAMEYKRQFRFSLREPDITNALQIATTINKYFNDDNIAFANDPSTVTIQLPSEFQDTSVAFLSRVEQISIIPDNRAKIIIDEKSGTVIMNKKIGLTEVAVSQGSLNIKVNGGNVHSLEDSSNLEELVEGLNALGVMPRDLINILYNLKRAGAIQGEIVVY